MRQILQILAASVLFFAADVRGDEIRDRAEQRGIDARRVLMACDQRVKDVKFQQGMTLSLLRECVEMNTRYARSEPNGAADQAMAINAAADMLARSITLLSRYEVNDLPSALVAYSAGQDLFAAGNYQDAAEAYLAASTVAVRINTAESVSRDAFDLAATIWSNLIAIVGPPVNADGTPILPSGSII